MNEDFQLIKSPLCQEVTSDGETVDVEIYRGESDKTWTLEVVDGYGNSTVWDYGFNTDNEAFKEVLQTIEEEGIGSLIGSPSDTDSALHPELPIDRKLRKLDEILCSDIAPETAMDVSTLEGFFTALIIGPSVIPPSKYMPWVWDLCDGKEEVIYDSMDQAQETMNLIMEVWNNIAKTFSTDPASFEPAYFRAVEWGAAEWCEGFILGTHLIGNASATIWMAQPKLVTPFLMLADEAGIEIAKKSKDAEAWMNAVPESLVGIHAYWLENRESFSSSSPSVPVRREHNVGRNDPCPCGSGKKFKKCCGAPPTLH